VPPLCSEQRPAAGEPFDRPSEHTGRDEHGEEPGRANENEGARLECGAQLELGRGLRPRRRSRGWCARRRRRWCARACRLVAHDIGAGRRRHCGGKRRRPARLRHAFVGPRHARRPRRGGAGCAQLANVASCRPEDLGGRFGASRHLTLIFGVIDGRRGRHDGEPARFRQGGRLQTLRSREAARGVHGYGINSTRRAAFSVWFPVQFSGER
jgi:hypothetical protein